MKKAFLFFYLLLFIFNTNAQVPVSKEPRHHVVFENEKIRLLNVVLTPGDTTLYHKHSTSSVFISLTKTRTVGQLLHQAPVEGTSTAGSMWFENLKPPYSKIHRVWNVDTAAFHVMDVELLAKDSGFTQKPLSLQHAEQALNTPWARTYNIQLARSEQLTIKEHLYPFLLVAYNDGTITMVKEGVDKRQSLQPGTFFWIKPEEQLTLLNPLDNAMHFALVEVR